MAKGDKAIRLVDVATYIDGGIEAATADIELPTLEAESEDYTGAGFLGTASIPVEGAFGSNEITINFTALTEDVFKVATGTHDFDFRGSQMILRNGVVDEVGLKITVRAVTKTTALGSLVKNSSTDSSITAEVLYLKVDVDGKNVLELDKTAYKYVVNGVDVIAKRRKNLGK